jgi:hypothetical protein
MAFSRTSTNWEGSRVSCSVREGVMGEASTIVERWLVNRKRATADFAAANIPYDVEAMRADTGGPIIPRVGAAYPTGSGVTWQDACGLRDVQFDVVQKSLSATLTYSTRYFYAANAKGLDRGVNALGSATSLPAGIYLQAKVTPTTRTRNVVAYRSNPGMTAASAANDASTADIGGAALGSSRGQNVDIRQVALKLRLIVDNEIAGQDVDALTGVIQAYTGRKNSASFLGYGTGQLVCEGGALNHIEHEFYELVMDYLWDEWYHHDQIPETGADGRPLVAGTPQVPSDVRFRRLARTAVDFNEIFPVSDIGRSWKYQCFKGVWY